MSKAPNYDQKVKTILDNLQPSERSCALTGEKWMMDQNEIDWYRKFNVPPSPWCHLTWMKILLGYAAAYQWWWNKDYETGKPVLSHIHPATGIKILPDDKWFAQDFAKINREYDSERPFFEIMRDLQLEVPINHSRNMEIPENSISRASFGDVNSYYVSGCRTKNCFFGNDSLDVESSAEFQTSNKITNSFNALHSQRIHGSKFVRESFDCMNCSFVFDCRNCENCFGAWNKRNAKFLLFNEQLSEQVWRDKVAAIDLGSRKTLEEYKERFYNEIMQDKAVWPENFNVQCDDCTGEYLIRCHDLKDVWMAEDSSTACYSFALFEKSENVMFSAGVVAQNVYGCFGPLPAANCKFGFCTNRCDDCEYCMTCYDCTHCFGCIGLRKKRFHIFNKEYSEQEYWQKVDELKCAMLDRGEYGQFFPMSMGPGYFPEAGAPIYYAAEPDEGKILGALDFEPSSYDAYGEKLTENVEALDPETVPDNIKDINPDEWANKPINDPVQGRKFTYYKPELEMYKKMGIAASNKHFIRRVLELYSQLNCGRMIDVKCEQCSKELKTAFNRAFPNKKVYCHECYLKYLEQHG
ncbi:MAG: hypothetical protein ABIH21_04535 [Patescibacteria group bacterium]